MANFFDGQQCAFQGFEPEQAMHAELEHKTQLVYSCDMKRSYRPLENTTVQKQSVYRYLDREYFDDRSLVFYLPSETYTRLST